jgi:hypothetical protein
MRRLANAVVLLGWVWAAEALAASPVDAEARFLAGLAGPRDGPYAALERSPAWKLHRKELDQEWRTLESRRLSRMRAWAPVELWPRIDPGLPLVYFFGGPDSITPQVLYPRAPTLVLCGLERTGEQVDLLGLPAKDLERALVSLRTTIRSTVDMSYFITSQMGADMLRSPLKGVLPVLLLFLARDGQEVLEVSAIRLDDQGQVVPEPGGPGQWRLRFRAAGGGPTRELYYLKLDLSNPVAEKTPGFFRFLEGLGPANSLLKAASFILHDKHFSLAREHLLGHSASILEDDSGVPFKFLKGPEWALTFYGKYFPPQGDFEKQLQEDLEKAFRAGHPRPLPFATGYQHSGPSSHLVLAVRRTAPDGGAR